MNPTYLSRKILCHYWTAKVKRVMQ